MMRRSAYFSWKSNSSAQDPILLSCAAVEPIRGNLSAGSAWQWGGSMLISLRKLATVVGMVTVLAASPSYALPLLDGSLAFAQLGVSQDGANLAASTLINVSTTISDQGLGDYSPVGAGNFFGPYVLDLSSLAALAANFSISNATYGSFAASTAQIIQQTANFLDVFLVGTFTPGPGLPGAVPSPTSFRVSLNQSGDSLAGGATLASPPVRVPEPASLALL